MNSDNMDRSSNKLNKLSTFMLAHIFNNRNVICVVTTEQTSMENLDQIRNSTMIRY